ncbi:MAG: hypothetical protein U0638_05460 [Phycisphaerales bacterium]
MKTPRSGSALIVVVGVTSVLIAGAAGTYALASIFNAHRAPAKAAAALAQSRMDQESNRQLKMVLTRAGLGADHLAAAGVEVSRVAEVVSLARGVLGEQGQSLAAADDSYRTAKVELENLQAKVRAGAAHDADTARMRAVEAALTQAETQRKATLTAIIAAASSVLSHEQTQTLAAIRSAPHDLPLKYRATAPDAAKADALRDALGQARSASATGEDLAHETTALLAQADADPEASAAQSRLNANAVAVRAAWDQAVGR